MSKQFYVIHVSPDVYYSNPYNKNLDNHNNRIHRVIYQFSFPTGYSYPNLRFVVYVTEEELLLLKFLIPFINHVNIHNYVIKNYFNSECSEEYLDNLISYPGDIRELFNSKNE